MMDRPLRLLLLSVLVFNCLWPVPRAAAGCLDLEALLRDKFRLQDGHVEELKGLLADKDPRALALYEALLESLPSPRYRLKELVRKGPKPNVLAVLRILATSDFRDTMKTLRSGRKISADERYALDVLIEQVWIGRKWQRFSTVVAKVIAIFRPSSYLEQMHSYRDRILAERTTLDDFLQTFAIGKYNLLATFVRGSRSVGEVLGHFKWRLGLLKTQHARAHLVRRAYLRTEIRKLEAFITMVEKNEAAWRTDAATMAERVTPSTWEWIVGRLYPNWRARAVALTEVLVISTALGVGIDTYLAPAIPGWFNPYNVIFPEENVLRDAYPIEDEAMSDEERQKIEEDMKHGTSFEELFK